MTEKETESYLVEETREVLWVDGQMKPFTAFKVFWFAYDYLLLCTNYTPQRLIDLAVVNQQEVGRSLEQSYKDVVTYVSNEMRRKAGMDG